MTFQYFFKHISWSVWYYWAVTIYSTTTCTHISHVFLISMQSVMRCPIYFLVFVYVRAARKRLFSLYALQLFRNLVSFCFSIFFLLNLLVIVYINIFIWWIYVARVFCYLFTVTIVLFCLDIDFRSDRWPASRNLPSCCLNVLTSCRLRHSY